jgi:hypothetical protein
MADPLFNPLPDVQLDERPRLRPLPPASPAVPRSEWDKGFSAGTGYLRGGLRGGVANLGALVGQDDFAREQAAIARREMEPEDAARVPSIRQVRSLQDAADWLEYGVATTLPTAAAGAVGGTAGFLLGGPVGAAIGAGVGSGLVQGGGLFAEQTGEQPNRDPGEIARATAVGGAAMGALDSIPVLGAFSRMGLGKIGQRILRNAARTAAEEGTTEGLQTIVERSTRKFLDDNYEVFDDEGRDEILNALALGGIIGGATGGAAGVMPAGSFRDRLQDLEAQDELRSVRATRGAEALRELAPEIAPQLDELLSTGDIDGLNDLIVQASRSTLDNYRKRNVVRPERDDILSAIAKMGGWSREEAEAQGIDPANFGRRGYGINRIFTNAGNTADGLAEQLSQYGYPVFDEQGNYNPNTLLDAVSRALSGERVGSAQMQEALMEAELAAREQDLEQDTSGLTKSQQRAVLTLQRYRDAEDRRRLAATNAARARLGREEVVNEADEQRDAEIRALLGEAPPSDGRTQIADVESVYEGDDSNYDFEFDPTDLTDNIRELPTDIEPEVTLGRRAAAAGYMASPEGEMYDPRATPSELQMEQLQRDRADLAAETRPLDEYLADIFRLGRTKKFDGAAPKSLDEFYEREAERVFFRETRREEAGRKDLDQSSADAARRAKKRIPGAREKGRKEQFLEQAYASMSPREFLRLFDVVTTAKVPPAFRGDVEAITLGGPKSVIEEARAGTTSARVRVERAWEKGQNWLTLLRDTKTGGGRVIRLPTTIKRIYEQVLRLGRDIDDATAKDLLTAFRFLQADALSKGREVLSTIPDPERPSVQIEKDGLVIGMINRRPITLGQAKAAAEKPLDAERWPGKIANEKKIAELEAQLEPIRQQLAAADAKVAEFEAMPKTPDGKDPKGLGLARNVRNTLYNKFKELDGIRKAYVERLGQGELNAFGLQENLEFEATGEDMSLMSPEFRAKEDVRFRSTHAQISRFARARAAAQNVAVQFSALARKILDAKSAEEMIALLESSLSNAHIRKLRERVQRRAPGESSTKFDTRDSRARIADELDQLAYEALILGRDFDPGSDKTLRRPDEMDGDEFTPQRDGGASTKRTEERAAPAADDAFWENYWLDQVLAGPQQRAFAVKEGAPRSSMEPSRRAGRQEALASFYKTKFSDAGVIHSAAPSRSRVQEMEAAETSLLSKWVRALGLKWNIQYVTSEELDGRSPTSVPGDALDALKLAVARGVNGVAATSLTAKNVYIAVSPNIRDARLREAVLAHEFGHAVFNEFVRGRFANKELVNELMDEFAAWRAKYRDEPLSELLKSKLSREILKSFQQNMPGMQDTTVSELPNAGYLLDFEEWFADNVSRWVKRTQPKPPDGKVERFFWQVAEFVRSIWGLFEDSKFKPASSVDTFMRSMIYTNHQHEAARWVDTMAAFVNYPADIRAKVEGAKTDAEAVRILNAAFDQTLAPFSRPALNSFAKAFYDEGLLTTEERRILSRAFGTDHARFQIYEYVRDNMPDLLAGVLDNPVASAAVGFQMYQQGLIDLGPKSEGVFNRLAETFQELFGIVTASGQANQVLAAYQSGLLHLRKHHRGMFSVQNNTGRRNILQRAGQASFNAYQKLLPMLAPLIPVQRRLFAVGNGALTQLVTMMAPVAGQGRSGEVPYITAKSSQIAQFSGRYRRLSEGWDEDFKRRVWELLYDPATMRSAAPSPELTAARNVKALFTRFYRYARGPLKLDFRRDYFPWVMNTKAVEDKRANLERLISQPKHVKRVEEIAKAWNIPEHEVPAAIIDNILDQRGFAATGVPSDRISSPFFAFGETRVLDFLYEDGTPVEREFLRSLMDENLDHTVYMYIEQMVKRTEFAKRFGRRGEGFEKLLKRAQALGATPEELQLGEDYVAAMLGYHGRRTNAALHRLFGSNAPSGEVINPVLRNVMGGVMVAQNLAILSLATFSSLVDPIGVGVRTGDFGSAFKAYLRAGEEVGRSLKAMFPGQPAKQMSRAEQMARALGVIEERLLMESLSSQYSSTYLPNWANVINEKFFRLTMLNQWTQVSRTAATAGAEQFLLAHRSGAETPNSKRYLDELGLQAGDIQETNGELKLLSHTERAAATKQELARDDRVRAAIFQFVDESIVRPSANTRPLWMSDPHFMLVSHLKGFMFAFHEQILRRSWNELNRGNFGPAAMLLSYIPAMMAANLFRASVKGLLSGEEPPDDPFALAFWEAIQRAGLTGIFQIFFDAKRDVAFGGTPADSLLGPTYDNTVSKLPQILTGDEGALVDQLPGQNIFGSVYEDLLPIE